MTKTTTVTIPDYVLIQRTHFMPAAPHGGGTPFCVFKGCVIDAAFPGYNTINDNKENKFLL